MSLAEDFDYYDPYYNPDWKEELQHKIKHVNPGIFFDDLTKVVKEQMRVSCADGVFRLYDNTKANLRIDNKRTKELIMRKFDAMKRPDKLHGSTITIWRTGHRLLAFQREGRRIFDLKGRVMLSEWSLCHE